MRDARYEPVCCYLCVFWIRFVAENDYYTREDISDSGGGGSDGGGGGGGAGKDGSIRQTF